MTNSTVTSGVYSAAAQVATPTFNPPGGFYCALSKSVTISSTTSGASMRYTINGPPPTSTSGTLIANGGSVTVQLTSDANLQAIAYKSGMTNSGVI